MKSKGCVSKGIRGIVMGMLVIVALIFGFLPTGCSLLSGNESSVSAPEPAAQPKDVQVKEILGWVTEVNLETGLIAIDDLEWITLEDTERIEELGLDGDFPNGYYLHNEVEKVERLPVTELATVWFVNWDDLASPVKSDVQGLSDFLEERNSLFRLTTENDVVVDVFEVYTP